MHIFLFTFAEGDQYVYPNSINGSKGRKSMRIINAIGGNI